MPIFSKCMARIAYFCFNIFLFQQKCVLQSNQIRWKGRWQCQRRQLHGGISRLFYRNMPSLIFNLQKPCIVPRGRNILLPSPTIKMSNRCRYVFLSFVCPCLSPQNIPRLCLHMYFFTYIFHLQFPKVST